MATIMKDGNYAPGTARVGDPISFFISLVQADVTAGTWYRLCPAGTTGNRTSETRLDVGTLPSWLTGVDFTDWRVKILNPGYNDDGHAAELEVKSISTAGVATLKDRVHESLPANGVHWVLYPVMLFDLCITLSEDATDAIDIGIGDSDVSSPTVRQISKIKKKGFATCRKFKTTRVDKCFYRFPTVAGNQEFEWGEHEPVRA